MAKDLASSQPFPHKKTRVMHTPKAVPHIKKGGKRTKSSHASNSFVKTGCAAVPKGGGKKRGSRKG